MNSRGKLRASARRLAKGRMNDRDMAGQTLVVDGGLTLRRDLATI